MGMTAMYHTKVPVEHSVAPAHRQNCSTGCSISLWSNRATFTVASAPQRLLESGMLSLLGWRPDRLFITVAARPPRADLRQSTSRKSCPSPVQNHASYAPHQLTRRPSSLPRSLTVCSPPPACGCARRSACVGRTTRWSGRSARSDSPRCPHATGCP